VVIKGSIPEHDARVKFVDQEHDLAVLETNMPPPEFAPLRYNIDELKTNDRVMVIGYPGEAGARGEYKVAEAQIEDIKINDSNNKWLYITDVLEHGNSGGPVFDTSGNVIGVVVAKAIITTSNAETHQEIREQKAGVVITLKTLTQFLFEHGIFSEQSGSGVVFANNYLEERARNYIVNVQCRIKSTEQPQGNAAAIMR
jgi:S1-C subfamily serine protease